MNRLPPYILGQVVAQMNAQRQKGDDVINLGMGNPDLPTPKHIVDKLIEAAQKPKNHRYSVSRGIPKLRQAICHIVKSQFSYSWPNKIIFIIRDLTSVFNVINCGHVKIEKNHIK